VVKRAEAPFSRKFLMSQGHLNDSSVKIDFIQGEGVQLHSGTRKSYNFVMSEFENGRLSRVKLVEVAVLA
jgi:hypothetical protein